MQYIKYKFLEENMGLIIENIHWNKCRINNFYSGVKPDKLPKFLQKVNAIYAKLNDPKLKSLTYGKKFIECLKDRKFVKNLVEHLFEGKIIKALGGWEKILTLPSKKLSDDDFKAMSEVKYPRVPKNFMPEDEDIVLTMRSGRPVIAVRIWDITNYDKQNIYNKNIKLDNGVICFSARHWVGGGYGNGGQSHWIVGSGRDDKVYTNTFYVHPCYYKADPELKQTYYDFINLLVNGKTINTLSDEKIYQCLQLSNKMQLELSATKIQSFFRGRKVQYAYESYKKETKSDKINLNEGIKLIQSGNDINKGCDLISEANNNIKEAKKKYLKL